jgi:hypothetical protein
MEEVNTTTKKCSVAKNNDVIIRDGSVIVGNPVFKGQQIPVYRDKKNNVTIQGVKVDGNEIVTVQVNRAYGNNYVAVNTGTINFN